MGALQSLKDMQSAQPADQDPTGFTGKYLKSFDDQVSKISQGQGSSGNVLAQQMLSRGVRQLRTAFADQSIEWEANQVHAYRKDALIKTIDQSAALVEANPALKQSYETLHPIIYEHYRIFTPVRPFIIVFTKHTI